jgi:hypothetical protein
MASQGGFIRSEPVVANIATAVDFAEGLVVVGPPVTANVAVAEDCAMMNPDPHDTQLYNSAAVTV